MTTRSHRINRSAFSPRPRLTALLLAAIAAAPHCLAEVRLPAIISNNMVLRKSQAVPVWGKADPGEQVAVSLGDQKASAVADVSGRWQAVLNLENSGPGPFEMTAGLGEENIVKSRLVQDQAGKFNVGGVKGPDYADQFVDALVQPDPEGVAGGGHR